MELSELINQIEQREKELDDIFKAYKDKNGVEYPGKNYGACCTEECLRAD